MGRFGHFVIDADGHGGEPLGWRRRIPDAFLPQMREYVASMKAQYGNLPGGGMKVSDENPRDGARPEDDLEFDVPMRPGMYDPVARIEDMDLEGIDVTVMFPPGSGEEWALGDPAFAAALCATLNDARAEYARHDAERMKIVLKLPMIDPQRAADELIRCAEEHSSVVVGVVTATHIQHRDLHDPVFDPVWAAAEKHGLAVCTHGGGQAPGQVPIMVDRFDTRLGKHAITHPVGAMQAVHNFTVGGILAKFPALRVGFMEANCGWLPFWLERIDEHWEHMPEQAPLIDKAPSEYFAGRCFLTAEPEEKMVGYIAESCGKDVVCYASDYCHWDCVFPDSVRIFAERTDLEEDVKAHLFARNAAKLYGLPLPV